MTSFTIQGREITIPVEVRHARSWFATFAVPFDAARSLIEYSGLVPASPLPSRALCSLAFVDYLDGDLDCYHEVAVAILVREPGAGGSGATSRKPAGAFIHTLPVDEAFTCEAGRSIWGFPKFLADIEIGSGERERSDSAQSGTARASRSRFDRARRLLGIGGSGWARLVHDGERVLTLSVGAGLPVPSRNTALDAFSWCDGVLRRTRWSLGGTGSRLRPGGAQVTLGEHPIAKELRGLGLPRRALMSGSIERVHMSFDAAREIPG